MRPTLPVLACLARAVRASRYVLRWLNGVNVLAGLAALCVTLEFVRSANFFVSLIWGVTYIHVCRVSWIPGLLLFVILMKVIRKFLARKQPPVSRRVFLKAIVLILGGLLLTICVPWWGIYYVTFVYLAVLSSFIWDTVPARLLGWLVRRAQSRGDEVFITRPPPRKPSSHLMLCGGLALLFVFGLSSSLRVLLPGIMNPYGFLIYTGWMCVPLSGFVIPVDWLARSMGLRVRDKAGRERRIWPTGAIAALVGLSTLLATAAFIWEVWPLCGWLSLVTLIAGLGYLGIPLLAIVFWYVEVAFPAQLQGVASMREQRVTPKVAGKAMVALVLAMVPSLSVFLFGRPIPTGSHTVHAQELSFEYFTYPERQFREMHAEELAEHVVPFWCGVEVFRFGLITEDPHPVPLVVIVSAADTSAIAPTRMTALWAKERIRRFFVGSKAYALNECGVVEVNGQMGYVVAWTERGLVHGELRKWKQVAIMSAGREYRVVFVGPATGFEDDYRCYCAPIVKSLKVEPPES